MALSVAPVKNPTLTGVSSGSAPKVSGVITATPGSNGFASLNGPTLQVAPPLPGGNGPTYASPAVAAPAPVYAPNLDFASITAQARSAAENNVNPYYTKQLNDFLSQQAQARAQTEAQTKVNIQNFQDQLAQTLQGNDTAKTRATEDTATNVGQINTAADNFQTDSGQQFTTDRLAQAKALATSGLTGGLGAQQTEAAALAHNTSETRAAADTSQKLQEQQLFKARTFEDLATSGEHAKTAEGKSETQANFDLSNFIANQGSDLTNKQSDLEQARQGAIQQQQQDQQRVLVQNFISSISNPAQRAAALQAYGGLL